MVKEEWCKARSAQPSHCNMNSPIDVNKSNDHHRAQSCFSILTPQEKTPNSNLIAPKLPFSPLQSLNKVTAAATMSCQKFAQQALNFCQVSLKPLFGERLWATSVVMASQGRPLKSKITLACSGKEELQKNEAWPRYQSFALSPHHC